MQRNQGRSTTAPHLIVGLGNPGKRYEGNRHNVGFQCLDHLAQQHDIAVCKRRFKGIYGVGEIDGHRVILLKPLTFMNESGASIGPLSRWFQVPPERILLIYDDLDLPLTKIRLRPGGGSGGHNGVKSAIAALGTSDFSRIRVGIGRPAYGDPIDYVLNDFSPDQEPVVRQMVENVEKVIRCYLSEGVHRAMDAYNANHF